CSSVRREQWSNSSLPRVLECPPRAVEQLLSAQGPALLRRLMRQTGTVMALEMHHANGQ
ncbi:hypothetical protein T484DRAFT_1764735, partial [Baffinella frigidus]